MAVFWVTTLISAAFADNTGKAVGAVRNLLEINFLGMVTFTYIDDDAKIASLMRLYFIYLVYLCVWGLIGRGVVPWDNILNEEDAFGPLMCIGFGYGYQYYHTLRNSRIRGIALIGCFLSLAGVILSFARGAFLSLMVVVAYSVMKSRNVFRSVLLLALSMVVVFISAAVFFSGDGFWKEMQSSTEGTSSGTGFDRKVLWSVALKIFEDHPIIGVGPYNFGVAAVEYVGKVSDRGDRYSDPGQIWGRALHNGYFQILCEQGILGSFLFVLILIEFATTNYSMTGRMRRLEWNHKEGSETGYGYSIREYYYILIGIRVGMLAFLLNTFFYDIIYYTWGWDLLIFNKLLHIHFLRSPADV
jgi:O-antigen ligase